MDVDKETISIVYLTSNSKEIVKEQQIKHEAGQIKKFVNKLKSRLKIHEYGSAFRNEIHCCYAAGVNRFSAYEMLN